MIEPYYEQDGITIYNADCREILPYIEPVALVLTDPPYSEATHKGARTRTTGANSRALVDFEHIEQGDLIRIFGTLVSLSRQWVVSFIDWRHALPMEVAGLPLIRLGVWVKPNSAPQLSGDRPAQGWEAIAFLNGQKQKRWNGGGKRAVYNCNREAALYSSTNKSTRLLKELIKDFLVDDGIILDPFMGSGSTLRAAKDSGVKAVGIEIEEKYCEIAAKRMAQSTFNFEEVA